MKRSSLAKLVGNMSWLHNQWVLYIVFAIALVNLLSYLTLGDMKHTLIFVLVGFVVSFFSKNMVVILIMAMGITNAMKIAEAVFYGLRKEGLEGMEEDEESSNAVDASGATSKPIKENMDGEDEEEKEGMEGAEEDEEKKENTETMAEIKKDSKELMSLQNKIEEGFSKIEPYMDKAEKLLTRLEDSMQTLSNAKSDDKKK